ncbi:MAG: hypothetical protein K2K74_14220 [Lachnospiraceae bacterium]|nr:hypothetical protein [Lachnospiraceae bacterium]
MPYSFVNYSTEELHTGEEPYELTDMYLTEDAVTLEKTGVSELVDAKGILTDGSIEDISRYAIWESSDTEVAVADQGRILAQSKGDAIITVK